MQRRTNAAMGVWTLKPAPPAQAWDDAFRSIELVGAKTLTSLVRDSSGEDEEFEIGDPIEAARQWLQEPSRRSVLTEPVLAQAEQTLDVAAAHMRELDVLAGEVAQAANESGGIDPVRLERVDAMTEILRDFALRMRSLLDPATIQPEDAEQRLRSGLYAASHGGGLSALVAAL